MTREEWDQRCPTTREESFSSVYCSLPGYGDANVRFARIEGQPQRVAAINVGSKTGLSLQEWQEFAATLMPQDIVEEDRYFYIHPRQSVTAQWFRSESLRLLERAICGPRGGSSRDPGTIYASHLTAPRGTISYYVTLSWTCGPI